MLLGWIGTKQGGNEIYFSKGSGNGTAFTKPERISDRKENSSDPQFASSGNNAYVVWTEHSPGNDNVIFTKGNGTTFTKPEHLSDKNGSQAPQLAASENIIGAVWMDHNKILFSESTNNGETFTSPITLSNNSVIANSSQLAISEKDNVRCIDGKQIWNKSDNLQTSAYKSVSTLKCKFGNTNGLQPHVYILQNWI